MASTFNVEVTVSPGRPRRPGMEKEKFQSIRHLLDGSDFLFAGNKVIEDNAPSSPARSKRSMGMEKFQSIRHILDGSDFLMKPRETPEEEDDEVVTTTETTTVVSARTRGSLHKETLEYLKHEYKAHAPMPTAQDITAKKATTEKPYKLPPTTFRPGSIKTTDRAFTHPNCTTTVTTSRPGMKKRSKVEESFRDLVSNDRVFGSSQTKFPSLSELDIGDALDDIENDGLDISKHTKETVEPIVTKEVLNNQSVISNDSMTQFEEVMWRRGGEGTTNEEEEDPLAMGALSERGMGAFSERGTKSKDDNTVETAESTSRSQSMSPRKARSASATACMNTDAFPAFTKNSPRPDANKADLFSVVTKDSINLARQGDNTLRSHRSTRSSRKTRSPDRNSRSPGRQHRSSSAQRRRNHDKERSSSRRHPSSPRKSSSRRQPHHHSSKTATALPDEALLEKLTSRILEQTLGSEVFAENEAALKANITQILAEHRAEHTTSDEGDDTIASPVIELSPSRPKKTTDDAEQPRRKIMSSRAPERRKSYSVSPRRKSRHIGRAAPRPTASAAASIPEV